jgi:hypothetical protein
MILVLCWCILGTSCDRDALQAVIAFRLTAGRVAVLVNAFAPKVGHQTRIGHPSVRNSFGQLHIACASRRHMQLPFNDREGHFNHLGEKVIIKTHQVFVCSTLLWIGSEGGCLFVADMEPTERARN